MKAQKKLITGTVLLMSAFLLGGCAFGTATTTSSHKAESTKVVKNDNHKSHKQSAASSEKENSSSSAVVSESRQALSSTTSNEAAGTNATQTTSTVSQGSQATSRAKQAPAQEVSVLNRFLAASGISQENGDAYMVTKQSNGNYQVEVRHTGAKQDQNIANLKGLYQYNPQTNAVHKLDINTNEYK